MKALILLCDAVGAATVVWILNWLALIPFRRAKDAHWTERARVLYPARVAAASSVLLVPMAIALGQIEIWPDLGLPWWLMFLAGWLGAVAGTYSFDRETLPWIGRREWFHHVLANWVIRFGVWGLFIAIAVCMPDELNGRAFLMGLVFVVLFLCWCWGGLLRVARLVGVLAAAPERLRGIIAGVAGRMNVPVRNSWLLRSAASLAFALPYTGELAFSERLLERHPDEEIGAIVAHELGHLAESRLTVATRVLMSLAWLLPWLFLKPLINLCGPLAFAGVALGSLVVRTASRKLSRRLENRADGLARTNEGEAGAYARALARLYEDNLVPAVLPRRRRTHPDLYDRLLACGVQPDYPRPKPPRANTVGGWGLAAVIGLLVAMAIARTGR